MMKSMGYRELLANLTILGSILAAASQLTKPGCQAKCGNINIPYPFGTTPKCYLDESFFINCTTNMSNTATPVLSGGGNIRALDISVDGEIRILASVSSYCYDPRSRSSTQSSQSLALSRSFTISGTRNKLTAVGCYIAAISGDSEGGNYISGCRSLCDGSLKGVTNGSCSGIGCCQISMPAGVKNYRVIFLRLTNDTNILDFNRCGFSFISEENTYEFSSLDLIDLQRRDSFPVILDWTVGNMTCQEAQLNRSSYACRPPFSQCVNSANGPGYRCSCSQGFQGNPYLSDGCQDIDECKVSNPCTNKCKNLRGGVSCSCPHGYRGDGMKNGTGCTRHNASSTFLQAALGTTGGITIIFLAISWLYFGLKKRKLLRLKEKFFLQNGGIMLQQKLSGHHGADETARVFSKEELERATNNYDENRIIGKGGFGTVYKGILTDDRVVAIKKSKVLDQNQVEQFINEVVVLSNINHRNVVKLLGCCLETQVPLLVYEFISNGTLHDHIHNQTKAIQLSWKIRVKIAAETAGVLSYLHSAANIPIIHRDMKPMNILLDNDYTAKVSDFGASRLVPLDQNELNTIVQGTLGYMDPEYFHTSQLTEKSDVYSFGVVLVELLTGRKAFCFDRPEKERSLSLCFLSSMNESRLFEVVDHRLVMEENSSDQVMDVAKLATRCLRIKGEERPSMKEVAMELEGIMRSILEKHPWENIDLNSEENKYLLGENSSAFGHGGNSQSVAGYDSMMQQIVFSLGNGR